MNASAALHVDQPILHAYSSMIYSIFEAPTACREASSHLRPSSMGLRDGMCPVMVAYQMATSSVSELLKICKIVRAVTAG